MRKNKLQFWVLLLLLLLSLQSCIILPPDELGTSAETTTQKPQPQPPAENPILTYYQGVVYTYSAQGINESRLTTELSDDYLLLMNKIYTLGENYVPKSMITLTCPTHYGEELSLEVRAAWALDEMYREMEADGITGLMVTSAYRSYTYQEWLFNEYVRKEQNTISDEAIAFLGEEYIRSEYLDAGKTGLSYNDAKRVVQSYSAKPGTSEHQTGLCVDFITDDMNNKLTVAFENTEEFAWLSANAYKFGFILRYPKDKEDVTGYSYEPWHYRFVGREAATNMYFSGLTLEEYLAVAQK
ncbi:MAG: M15 family metallopeptidase [Clostridia bacterium]|nr:M15 family metallopeptidase [Clostridia bacterium]